MEAQQTAQDVEFADLYFAAGPERAVGTYTLRRQTVWKPEGALQVVPAPCGVLELSGVPEPLAVPDERPERALAVPALSAAQALASLVFRLPEASVVTADAAALKQAS